jgi:hypothetical protein
VHEKDGTHKDRNLSQRRDPGEQSGREHKSAEEVGKADVVNERRRGQRELGHIHQGRDAVRLRDEQHPPHKEADAEIYANDVENDFLMAVDPVDEVAVDRHGFGSR